MSRLQKKVENAESSGSVIVEGSPNLKGRDTGQEIPQGQPQEPSSEPRRTANVRFDLREKRHLGDDGAQDAQNGGSSSSTSVRERKSSVSLQQQIKRTASRDNRMFVQMINKGNDSEQRLNPYAFGAFAHYLILSSSVIGIMLGVTGLMFSLRSPNDIPAPYAELLTSLRYKIAGIMAIAYGGIAIIYHGLMPKKIIDVTKAASHAGKVCRAILFFLCGGSLCISYWTMLQGVLYCCVGIVYLISFVRREEGSIPDTGKNVRTEYWSFEGRSFAEWWSIQVNRGAISRIWAIILILLLNGALFAYKYMWAVKFLQKGAKNKNDVPCFIGGTEKAENFDECDKLMDLYATWFPLAKGFGLTLDINATLVILVVVKGLIAKMHEAGQSGGILGFIFGWIPVHKNVLFHKYIAALIAVGAFGHCFSHHMCMSWTLPVWKRTLIFYGTLDQETHEVNITKSIWGTGYVILFAICIFFASAQEPIRRLCFELFYWSHYVGVIIFFVSLWWHSTIFWWFGTFVLIIYLMDTLSRRYLRQNARTRLLSVSYSNPIMTLNFDAPWVYKAGQFCLVSCPAVDAHEQHPFTINSAYKDGKLSFAIKVYVDGWTGAVEAYLRIICQHAHATGMGVPMEVNDGWGFEFTTIDKVTGQTMRGIENWQGRPIFHLDGGHAAPATHYVDYEDIIICGAGIGLTPVNSILQTLTKHDWHAHNHCPKMKTRHVTAVWLCPHNTVKAFRWFAAQLEEVERGMNIIREADPEHEYTYEMHLYVTSMPKNFYAQKGAEDPYEVSKEPLEYCKYKLADWMMDPPGDSTKFDAILAADEKPNTIGSMFVWGGRPDFNKIFNRVKARREARSPIQKEGVVGVFFCGVTAIAFQLQMAAKKTRSKLTKFKVMKESF